MLLEAGGMNCGDEDSSREGGEFEGRHVPRAGEESAVDVRVLASEAHEDGDGFGGEPHVNDGSDEVLLLAGDVGVQERAGRG